MSDDTMDFDKTAVMSSGHILYHTSANGWRIYGGIAKTDRTTSYRDKFPLFVTPDTSNHVNLFYRLNTSQIELGKLEFSGSYKFWEVGSDTLSISLKLSEEYRNLSDSTEVLLFPQDSVWTSFQVIFTPDRNADFVSFVISFSGSSSFWLNDCKVKINGQPLKQVLNIDYGAEKDKEFDNGSNIDLGELTPQKIENLEILGKMWGFLKYYHPEITQGKYNWDYELFRVLPYIVNAKDKKERNRLLNKWIDKYEKVQESKDYIITDSTEYSRIVDLNWINDSSIFDRKLIDKLNKVKTAKRNSKFNYYQPFPVEKLGEIFPREKAYENISWEDQGFRILLLFRLWNVIEYCFPYTEMTDVPWETLLKYSIPSFFNPKSKAEYELEILKLAAHINDSHGYVYIPNSDLNNTVLASLYTHPYRLPVELIKSAEGYLVIKTTESLDIERGDIIYSVEGKPVTQMIEEMRPYIIASNEDGVIRNLLSGILSSDKPEMNVTIIRDGKNKDIHITNFSKTRNKESIRSWENYNLSEKSIIHVDNIKSADQNRDIMQNNMYSKGLIIDMRAYPWNANLSYIPDYLFPANFYPLWLSDNKTDMPGCFYYWHFGEKSTKPDLDYYCGKVVILVDENTQSAGETYSMLFSYFPRNVTIGSQTAGANGGVNPIFLLPTGIHFRFSGQGAFYPEGETLQRKGIKIDIPVRPTVQDIKEGRDVWMEKAIKYIEND